MPELPEVENVKEALKKRLVGKVIKDVTLYYNNLIDYPSVIEFKNNIIDQEIKDIKRRGKWLIFVLNDYYLLSHLKMEGKYLFRKKVDYVSKHEHIRFLLSDESELRYMDTRKFGKMLLIRKSDINDIGPIKDLGLEPWDSKLTASYLYNHYRNKRLPIKTVLLDQSIITGIGNIYADEILCLSMINPLRRCSSLSMSELDIIINNTRKILMDAIKAGGTTIRSFTSSEGIHGEYQQNLLVHNRTNCSKCGNSVIKIVVNGRGTYYCSYCQDDEKKIQKLF